MRLHRVLLTGLLLIPGVLCPAQAAITKKVSMKSHIGIDPQIGLIRHGTWAPLTVAVDNANEVGFDATIVVLAFGAADAPILHLTRPLYVSANSQRRVAFALPGYPTVTRYEVRLIDTENYILSEDIQRLTAIKPFDELLLVVGRNRDGVRWANRPTPKEGVPRRHLEYCSMEDLPEQWLALQSVHTLCFQDAEYNLLDAARFEAMRDWIAWGGHLVVSAGAGTQGLRESRLAKLLPAEVGESITVNLDWSSLDPAPDSVLEPTPAVIARLTRLAGQTVLSSPPHPLIVSHPVGRGRVTVVAFSLDDHTLLRWPASPWLADLLFAPLRPDQELRAPMKAPGSSIFSAASLIMQREHTVRVPPARHIGYLFAGYLFVAVPLAYLIARRFTRPAYAWFSLPIVAVGFSVGIYAFVYQTVSGRVQTSALALLETTPGSDVATGRTVYNVYSPVRGIRQFIAGQKRLALTPYFREDSVQYLGASIEPPQIALEESRATLSLAFEPQTWESCNLDGAADIGGVIDGALTLQADGTSLHAVVHNRTPLDLYQVSIVGCRSWMEIGDLPAGASIEASVPWPAKDMNETVLVPAANQDLSITAPSPIGSRFLETVRESETIAQSLAVVAYTTGVPWTIEMGEDSNEPFTATVLVVHWPLSAESSVQSVHIPRRALALGFGPLFGWPHATYGGRPYVTDIHQRYLAYTSVSMAAPLPPEEWELESITMQWGEGMPEAAVPYDLYNHRQSGWASTESPELIKLARDPIRGSLLARPTGNRTWDGQDAVDSTGSSVISRIPSEPIRLKYNRKAPHP